MRFIYVENNKHYCDSMNVKTAKKDRNRNINWVYPFIYGGLTVVSAIVYQSSNIAAILGKNENAAVNSVWAFGMVIAFGLMTIGTAIENIAEKTAALKEAERR